MSRIAYVDGVYLPLQFATVSVEDRGLQFGDAVYEVCEIKNGQLIDVTRHLDRLDRSLAELKIINPLQRAVLTHILREVTRRNLIKQGHVYVQITRGTAPRDHCFPSPSVRPTVIVTARRSDPLKTAALVAQGISVISTADNRWQRVDIKTTGLLPNVMARQTAKEAGAKEAWFVDDKGFVTEGAATNAWIVTHNKTILTRPADFGILKGITRTVLLQVAEKLGYNLEERAFTLDEAKQADEAFITGATTIVMPVVSLDGVTIGDGKPGLITLALRAAFHEMAEKTDSYK